MTDQATTEKGQVLGFLDGAIKEHLHTTSRLTRARDEVDRLRRALAVAEQTVAEALRDSESGRDILRDALDLARQSATAPVFIEGTISAHDAEATARAVEAYRTSGRVPS